MWRRRESVKSIVYNKRLAPFWMDGGSFMLCPLVQFMSFHYKWQSSNAKEFRSPDLRATWRFGPLSNSASTLLSADTISAPINFHFMVSDADDCADHTQILLHSLSLSLSLTTTREKSEWNQCWICRITCSLALSAHTLFAIIWRPNRDEEANTSSQDLNRAKRKDYLRFGISSHSLLLSYLPSFSFFSSAKCQMSP